MVGTNDCNVLVLRQCQWGDVGSDFGRDGSEVSHLSLTNHKGLQLGDIEKLVRQSTHALDILAQRLCEFAIVNHVDLSAKYSERCAQLMGSIGGEFALPAKPFLELVKRLVHRANQRHHLLRHPIFGES